MRDDPAGTVTPPAQGQLEGSGFGDDGPRERGGGRGHNSPSPCLPMSEHYFRDCELIRGSHRLTVPECKLAVHFPPNLIEFNLRAPGGVWLDCMVIAPKDGNPYAEGTLWDFREPGRGANLKLLSVLREPSPILKWKLWRHEHWRFAVVGFRWDDRDWFPKPEILRQSGQDEDFLGTLKKYLTAEFGEMPAAKVNAEGAINEARTTEAPPPP